MILLLHNLFLHIPLQQIIQQLFLLLFVLQVNDVMFPKLETKILAKLNVFHLDKDNPFLLTVGVVNLLARPLRTVRILGVHEKKNVRLVNSVNDNINKLLVTFNASQVNPATADTNQMLNLFLENHHLIIICSGI